MSHLTTPASGTAGVQAESRSGHAKTVASTRKRRRKARARFERAAAAQNHTGAAATEPRETLGRFLRRFYLITKSTLLHPTTDTYIDDLPDGRMVAREVSPGAD